MNSFQNEYTTQELALVAQPQEEKTDNHEESNVSNEQSDDD